MELVGWWRGWGLMEWTAVWRRGLWVGGPWVVRRQMLDVRCVRGLRAEAGMYPCTPGPHFLRPPPRSFA